MPILIFSPGANFGHHPLVRPINSSILFLGGHLQGAEDILLTDEVHHLTAVVGIQDLQVQEADTDLDLDHQDLTDPHHVGLCADHGALHPLPGVEVSLHPFYPF